MWRVSSNEVVTVGWHIDATKLPPLPLGLDPLNKIVRMTAFVTVNNKCGVIVLRLAASVLTTPDEPQSLKTLPRELFPKPPNEI